MIKYGGAVDYGIETPNPDRSKISIDWNKISEERIKRIRWEIEQGLNPVEAFEVDETAPKPVKRASNNPNGAERQYDHDEIVRLYHEEGLTGEQIAEQIGANKSTIYGVLRKAKVTRSYRGGHNQFTTNVRTTHSQSA